MRRWRQDVGRQQQPQELGRREPIGRSWVPDTTLQRYRAPDSLIGFLKSLRL